MTWFNDMLMAMFIMELQGNAYGMELLMGI